jgi:hypothetical protein
VIDWLVPHQANKRIIESTAERMGLAMDKVMVTIHKYGTEAQRQGQWRGDERQAALRRLIGRAQGKDV